MQRCPNCGRPTLRTEDWACQWCGYPLLSGAYKKIPKTYQELKEERLYGDRPPTIEEDNVSLPVESSLPPTRIPAPEPEPVLEAEPLAEPVSEPERESEAEPVSEPKTEAEVEPESRLEPVVMPESQPEPEPETKPKPKPESELPPGIVGITVEELSVAYDADKVAADTKFQGKILWVTGIVDRVVIKEVLDTVYILLTDAGKRGTWKVRCSFEKTYAPELNRLKAGQTVTVQGKYDSYRINILLIDCVLVD